MVNVKIENIPYLTNIKIGDHGLIVDEPESKGGKNLGPSPKGLMLAALGACVVITLKMYADRKGWDIGEVVVDLDIQEEGGKSVIMEEIGFENDLSPEQLDRLNFIATKCPVSKMISSGTEILNKGKQI
jgi:putative redox protein